MRLSENSIDYDDALTEILLLEILLFFFIVNNRLDI
jgi:hypothetical protein